MPMSMKVQPIDVVDGEEREKEKEKERAMPVVKSRLRRLFRIGEKLPEVNNVNNEVVVGGFEPSSVCLAKMVQNFLEESNNEKEERERSKCGRNRCNCFNGNGSSDGEDGDTDNNVSPADVSDFVKSLVTCASMSERSVMGETARIVAEKSKGCKRKDELRKAVTEGLVVQGYDAAVCKSKWEKSPSFPAGEYEYVDVIIGGERLIIDIDFRSEFEVARSTKTYKSILQTLPHIFVGKAERLSKIICILSEAAKQSLKKKGMHIPPWRKADYVQAKWLSPPTRLVSTSATATDTVTPPPSPLSPPIVPADGPNLSINETQQADEAESDRSSPQFETVFEMSESSGEEDVKVKRKEQQQKYQKKKPVEIDLDLKKVPTIGVKIVAGLASITEEKAEQQKF